MLEAKQPVGRPRDGQIDHAIAAATRELLAERGYAKLTVDAVASRAGIGKAAIYRRFTTKQEMIFAATVHDMEEQPPPDSGSLRGDLQAIGEVIAGQLSTAPPDVLHGLLADIHGDKSLGARFTGTFIERERFVIDTVLARAVERGELEAMPDAAIVHALLLGPIFYWLLILIGDRDALPELVRTAVGAVADTLTAT
ncbi:TetR/AcrR family transcriptional regulator [Glycomyces tritici]|uniref:TetR/AcrR family transcriptional regulator n=1 Tax=Glycomyces tritici TaxID=2665176 RepID=A0ABT7YTW8_9ACTN|nr:TetR/AcrR family transcriptional regulator [Glycomyces tritici]MDN3242042.1 TetR/AcrR family transcriptional regulator [Glycomyces tritici]